MKAILIGSNFLFFFQMQQQIFHSSQIHCDVELIYTVRT